MISLGSEKTQYSSPLPTPLFHLPHSASASLPHQPPDFTMNGFQLGLAPCLLRLLAAELSEKTPKEAQTGKSKVKASTKRCCTFLVCQVEILMFVILWQSLSNAVNNSYLNYKIIAEDTQDSYKRNNQSSRVTTRHNFDVKIKIQCQIDNRPDSRELLPN